MNAKGKVMDIGEESSARRWSWTGFAQLSRDVRFATRMLRRKPAFTAVAVFSLAIGIGANTAIFSFANAILIRTLAVTDANRLVIIRQDNEAFGIENSRLRQDVLRRLQLEDIGFEDLLGVSSEEVLFRDRERSTRLQAEFVTPNYFSMLGVQPAAGRLLDGNDDSTGAAVAVISYNLWTDRFGAQSNAIGRRIEIDGMPFHIVGVTQPGFSGLSLNAPRDLQVPAAMMGPLSHGNGLEAVGRLSPAVSEERTLAQLNIVAKAIQRDVGLSVNDNDDFRFRDGSQGLGSGKEEFRRPVLILGLLKIGIRLTVGASRSSVIAMFLREGSVLVGCGLLLGVPLSFVCGRIAQSLLYGLSAQDASTIAGATGLLVLSGAAAAVIPAWRAARLNAVTALRQGVHA